MRYQAQLQTFSVIVENAPAETWQIGAQIFVDIPKNFNVQKVSIYSIEDLTGTINIVPGGVNTSGNQHINSYNIVQINQNYPIIMEAIPGSKIEQGFYLAVLSGNIGDATIFQILFEGYLA